MMRIKKMVAVVLAMLILCLAMPLGVVADDAADFTVKVKADKDIVSCGNTVTFTVYVKDINVEGGLLSVDIPFRFDTDVFEFIGKAAIYPEEWTEPDDYSYTAPKNGLLWLRSLDMSGDLTFSGCDRDNAIGFRVILKAKTDAALGVTVVTVNGDGGFEVISGTAADGMCSEVGGTGDPATLAVTAFDVLMGDVNDDGYVDNLDAANVLKYDAAIIDFDEEQLKIADINNDGWVDNGDAALILKIDAGLA